MSQLQVLDVLRECNGRTLTIEEIHQRTEGVSIHSIKHNLRRLKCWGLVELVYFEDRTTGYRFK